MSNFVHSVEQVDGSTFSRSDRVILANLPGVVTAIGGGAGQSVTTAVVCKGLPAKYTVNVTPNQDATAWVTAKTTSGFNVVIAPRLAASTLAAGTVDIQVVG
jgi:hypothetical protein